MVSSFLIVLGGARWIAAYRQRLAGVERPWKNSSAACAIRASVLVLAGFASFAPGL
jgi:hypothetical protein